MIFIWALLLAAAVSNVSGSRMNGGSEASSNQHPYMVQVEYRNLGIFWIPFAGGAIVTRRYFVSLASNFDGPLYVDANRRGRVGSSRRETGGVIYYIQDRVNHPNYHLGVEGDSDIALITFSQLLPPPSDTIASIPISSENFVMQAGQSLTYVGFGNNGIMRAVENVVVANQTCTQVYQSLPRPYIITDKMVCTLPPGGVGGASPCEDDLGGPAVMQGVLVGLPSHIQVCGSATYPVVSTIISAFSRWLQEQAVA